MAHSKADKEKIAELEQQLQTARSEQKQLDKKVKDAATANDLKYTPSTTVQIGEAPKVSLPSFGLSQLTELKEPKSAFTWPKQLTWEKTPQQIVEQVHICKKSSKLAEAKKKEAKYAEALEGGKQDDDPTCKAMFEKLLADVQTEVKQLQIGGTVGTAAVETMKSNLQDAVTAEAKQVEKSIIDVKAADSR